MSPVPVSEQEIWESELIVTKSRLDLARLTGDTLGEEIAQAAIDNLLDHRPTHQTQQTEGQKDE